MRKIPVAEILNRHWREYGRTYYTRHDYEGISTDAAETLMEALQTQIKDVAGKKLGGRSVEMADDFRYVDPVDGSVAERQGVQIGFDGGGRIIYRLSGTGTEGATLRLYVEGHESDPERHHLDRQRVLADLVGVANELARIGKLTGRHAPDVIT